MTAPHETYNLENITVLDFIYQHAKPEHWIEVKSDEGLYWWNPETEETTALGAPRPPIFRQSLQNSSNYSNQFNPPPQTLGSSMKTYFFLGIGMTAGITLVRLAIGI